MKRKYKHSLTGICERLQYIEEKVSGTWGKLREREKLQQQLKDISAAANFLADEVLIEKSDIW